jgi:hypothetical protein
MTRIMHENGQLNFSEQPCIQAWDSASMDKHHNVTRCLWPSLSNAFAGGSYKSHAHSCTKSHAFVMQMLAVSTQTHNVTHVLMCSLVYNRFNSDKCISSGLYAAIFAMLPALMIWALAACKSRRLACIFIYRVRRVRKWLIRSHRRKRYRFLQSYSECQLKQSRRTSRILWCVTYLLIFYMRANFSLERESATSGSWIDKRIRWRKRTRKLSQLVKKISRMLDSAIASIFQFKHVSSKIFAEETNQASPTNWTTGHFAAHMIVFAHLNATISNPLDALFMAVLIVTISHIMFMFTCRTSRHLIELTSMPLAIVFTMAICILSHVCLHFCEEFREIQRALCHPHMQRSILLLYQIVAFACIVPIQSIAPIHSLPWLALLFSSNYLLLDVIALLSLQFLLALCGDVHPNPGPCKNNKSKMINRNKKEKLLL